MGGRVALRTWAWLLLAFVALILPLVLFSAWSYRRSLESDRDRSLVEAVQLSQTAAALVQGLLRGLDGTTLAMSGALGAQQGVLNDDTVGPYLDSVGPRFPFVRNIFLMDPAGLAVAATLDESVGRDFGDRPYTRALLSGEELVLSDLLQSALTGEPTIVMARTVRSPDGALRGMLAVVFYPARLAEILPQSLPEDAVLSLFDQQGRLIYSSARPDLPWEQREHSTLPEVQAALAGQTIMARRGVLAVDGPDRIGAVAPVPESGWAVGISRSAATVERPLQTLYRQQMLALGVVAASSFVVALILSRVLSSPLVRLATHARAFGRGEVGTLAPVAGPVEVQTLAEALTTMAAEVQTRFAEREAAQRRLLFLGEASTVLAATLDYQTTLAQVARLTVPELGDWCTVHMAEDGGQVTRTALAAVNQEQEALLQQLRRRYPFDPRGPHPVARVLRTGEPLFFPEVSDALFAGFAQDEEQARTLATLIASYMVVPLIARGQTLGVIAIAWSRPGRRYGLADLALAQELARRAALAVDTARLYAQARDALRDRESALAARDQFLSVASHELRTPLTALKSYMELARNRLRRGAAPEELDQLLAWGDVQAERLNELVSALLDVSRIATGRLELETEPVAIAPLVQRVVEMERAADPGRAIYCSLPTARPVLDADAGRLEQVLVNLLENARKYSPPNRPVEVCLSATDDTVAIAVRDHGIGIPLDDQERLFERFYRAGNIDKGVSGLGLGLHVANEIVRAHGGTLAVASTPGCGSVFTISLPRPSNAMAASRDERVAD